MQIYINKNGQQLGPVSEEKVLEMVARGELKSNDFMIREGDSEWKMIAQSFPQSATVKKGGSAFGIVMIIFGILGSLVFGLFSLITFFSIEPVRNPYNANFYRVMTVIWVIFVLGSLLMAAIGLILNGRAKRK